jgi:hypothetical protein
MSLQSVAHVFLESEHGGKAVGERCVCQTRQEHRKLKRRSPQMFQALSLTGTELHKFTAGLMAQTRACPP